MKRVTIWLEKFYYQEYIKNLYNSWEIHPSRKMGKDVNRHFSEVEINKHKRMISFTNNQEMGIKTVLHNFILTR